MKTLELDSIGTHLSVLIETDKEIDALWLQIEDSLSKFEQTYSRFLDNNWLADLNTSRQGELDIHGGAMLEYACKMAEITNGYFDPTVGKRLTELGYGIVQSEISTHTTSHGDYRDIEIKGGRVILHGDILLEFGGVGKGYLIDMIVKLILSYFSPLGDVPRYLIDFGGDLSGKGGWKVGLESPFTSDEVIGTLILDDHYLSCSAGTKRKWGAHHHLIDPHTGESAREVIASFVEGNSGMLTDAYATTLCVMPWKLACDTLGKTPEITGVIVRNDGTLYKKEGSKCEIFS